MLSAYNGVGYGIKSTTAAHYQHIFCISCFKEINNVNNPTNFKCPCCYSIYYDFFILIEEAILVGQGAYSNFEAAYHKRINCDIFDIHDIYKNSIKLFEQAHSLNKINLYTLASLMMCYDLIVEHCHQLVSSLGSVTTSPAAVSNLVDYNNSIQAIHDYGMILIDNVYDKNTGQPLLSRMEGYYSLLAKVLHKSHNYAMSLKYHKLAYNYSLRNSYNTTNTNKHTIIANIKASLKVVKELYDSEPKLRFEVGDEVEVLYEVEKEVEKEVSDKGEKEVESNSTWRLAEVTELYYHERTFPVTYNAPYRVRLLNDDGDDDGVHDAEGKPTTATTSSSSPTTSDQPSTYIYVKDDIDRCIRLSGARSIEETRYRTMLDAKVEELAYVYCSKEFMIDVYNILRQDSTFCEALLADWRINLSIQHLYLYRMLIMYRQPMTRIDSGYHIPTVGEVANEIKVYFDKSRLGLGQGTVPDVGGEEQWLQDMMYLKAADLIILTRLSIYTTRIENSHTLYGHVKDVKALLSSTFLNYTHIFIPEAIAGVEGEEGEGHSDYMTAPTTIVNKTDITIAATEAEVGVETEALTGTGGHTVNTAITNTDNTITAAITTANNTTDDLTQTANTTSSNTTTATTNNYNFDNTTDHKTTTINTENTTNSNTTTCDTPTTTSTTTNTTNNNIDLFTLIENGFTLPFPPQYLTTEVNDYIDTASNSELELMNTAMNVIHPMHHIYNICTIWLLLTSAVSSKMADRRSARGSETPMLFFFVRSGYEYTPYCTKCI